VSKYDIAKNVIKNMDGIAKTSELINAGLTKSDISSLIDKSYIERVKHSYYRLFDEHISEEQIINTLLPEGVVCVHSALFHYGYSDFTPREWSIAVPRTFSRTKLNIDEVPIKVYYIQNELFDLGKRTDNFNGYELFVYDRERTICDCFKYKNKLDSEIFSKAINAYIADDKKNLANLSKYAKQLRVYKKVTELMEVLLSD
jgi:predicted transcriptional regulator of viral defense system